MARILMHTLGSSGDLNPCMALGLELRQRGHDVHFALSPMYAAKARALGFSATDSGPDPNAESDLMKQLLTPDRVRPVLLLFRAALIPAIVPATESLEPLVREADLFISHSIQLAAPAVAARTSVPWISLIPAPLYPSRFVPPPGMAWKGAPAALSRLAWRIAYRVLQRLDEQANVEYAKVGLPPQTNVALEAGYSRRLTLGLWSPAFSPRPPDWPDWLQLGGYARWDGGTSEVRAWPRRDMSNSAPSAKQHGDRTSPCVVFTLGSSVVTDPRGFWETALQVIGPTDWRAILLGAPAGFPVPATLQSRVTVIPFAPYADIFPLADAIVHQGGLGTTQAACYYGVGTVIIPRGFDQFENAAHVQREGWGLRLIPEDLTANLLRIRLRRLLESSEIRQRVQALGAKMQSENGPTRSGDLVEAALA